MSSYGSIILPKNVFKNVLPTIGSNFHIPNGRHELNSVENENAPYLDDISVTSQHMKKNGYGECVGGISFVIQGQGHTLDQWHRSLSATSK